MGKLNEAKIFGGIGALLLLIGGFIPTIGPIISIIGLVLVFIAVKYVSDETKDNSIFKNFLINFICTIIAIIAVIAIVIGTIGAIGGFSFFSELENEEITDFESFWDYFEPFIGGMVVALLVGWILLVIGTVYLRKSYNSIANHTQVDLFRTTGTVYFIGAITLIILIGALILLIARILEIASFFSLPQELPAKEAMPTSEK
jgi:uncharacterized membrane protein